MRLNANNLYNHAFVQSIEQIKQEKQQRQEQSLKITPNTDVGCSSQLQVGSEVISFHFPSYFGHHFLMNAIERYDHPLALSSWLLFREWDYERSCKRIHRYRKVAADRYVIRTNHILLRP
jgi:hypothetical protein